MFLPALYSPKSWRLYSSRLDLIKFYVRVCELMLSTSIEFCGRRKLPSICFYGGCVLLLLVVFLKKIDGELAKQAIQLKEVINNNLSFCLFISYLQSLPPTSHFSLFPSIWGLIKFSDNKGGRVIHKFPGAPPESAISPELLMKRQSHQREEPFLCNRSYLVRERKLKEERRKTLLRAREHHLTDM